MDKLKNVNKVQTTKYLDYHVEVELETRDKQGVHSVALVLPKVEIENRARISTDNLLENILARDNMMIAMNRVISNKGSHGVDGMKYDELRDFVKAHCHTIKLKLLDGTYNPSPVRIVEIPKDGKGIRLHPKSYQKFKSKIREFTNRNTGISMDFRIMKLNEKTMGWINYFGIAKGKGNIQDIEGWIRRRLRACIWKQ